MNDDIRHILESSIIYLNVSKDKNDNYSIYIGDLVGSILGIDEARENILEFCKRQETSYKMIESKIPEMIALIDRCLNE